MAGAAPAPSPKSYSPLSDSIEGLHGAHKRSQLRESYASLHDNVDLTQPWPGSVSTGGKHRDLHQRDFLQTPVGEHRHVSVPATATVSNNTIDMIDMHSLVSSAASPLMPSVSQARMVHLCLD